MPLPDERPRQSVANLIGRFENQTKRQSISSAPPRSTSVVSHTTGDSAKEEVKERREWPPKNIEKPSTTSPPSSFIRQSLPTQPSFSSSTSSPSDVGVVSEAAKKNSMPIAELQSSAKAPLTPQRKPSVDSSAPAKAPSTPQRKPSADSSAASAISKSPAAASSTTKPGITKPKATTVKSPPTQPLKAQHTGQSTTSTTTSTRKAAVKSTPALPKTPSRQPQPPGPIRAKTPTTTRPKTPSTGLFAPTAASLARARNAQPPLPTPTKKPTLSSSAAERLSKPTAASLSKARSPPSVAPPTASPRGAIRTAAKPKTTKVSKETKNTSVSKAAVTAAAASVGAVVASVGVAAAGDSDEQHVSPVEQNGHSSEVLHIASQSDDSESIPATTEGDHRDFEALEEGTLVVAEEVEAPEELVEVASESSAENNVDVSQATNVSGTETNLETVEPDDEYEEPTPAESNGDIVEHAPQEDVEDAGENTQENAHAGNNIEDIVNLLESVPVKIHPEITEDVQEIPDEE